ncbi:flagellar basal body P-ring formation chaperone FlgA [Bordetella sp. 02P26C-1]|uniref:flagellar basal body P-ring formation chaperone FlgA n=1 Tax=Bordetella sp. 02P26C-1 TaxID=2683195 RepID=UPI00135490CF|nr:flagellar basal body P-ring formation chaperone FlgA [Bordetella sp. 02P26C-1]MVW78211.1 flagellar basal body P-ring formation protein FlgA [Bordetella sp. 02P26C-1]
MTSRPRNHFLHDFARVVLVAAALVFGFTSRPAVAQSGANALSQAIADQVEQYLFEAAAQQYEGEPIIHVTPPAAPQSLAGCDAYHVYMPPGRKIRSDTTVAVRCQHSDAAPVYVRAKVEIHGTYYVAAQTLGVNQAITADMLDARTGDLLRMPDHALTTPDQLVGRVTTHRIQVGKPVRMSATRSAQAIRRGETVKIEVRGPGLHVTNQGEALTTADIGGTIEVKIPNGKLIQGVVSDAGTVVVTF